MTRRHERKEANTVLRHLSVFLLTKDPEMPLTKILLAWRAGVRSGSVHLSHGWESLGVACSSWETGAVRAADAEPPRQAFAACSTAQAWSHLQVVLAEPSLFAAASHGGSCVVLASSELVSVLPTCVRVRPETVGHTACPCRPRILLRSGFASRSWVTWLSGVVHFGSHSTLLSFFPVSHSLFLQWWGGVRAQVRV